MNTDLNQLVASHAMLRLLMLEATGQRHPCRDGRYAPAGDISREACFLGDLLVEIGSASASDEFLSEVIAEFYHWIGAKPDEVKAFHQKLSAARLLAQVADKRSTERFCQSLAADPHPEWTGHTDLEVDTAPWEPPKKPFLVYPR